MRQTVSDSILAPLGSNVFFSGQKVLVAIFITSNGWLWHDSGRLSRGDHDVSPSRISRVVLKVARLLYQGDAFLNTTMYFYSSLYDLSIGLFNPLIVVQQKINPYDPYLANVELPFIDAQKSRHRQTSSSLQRQQP